MCGGESGDRSMHGIQRCAAFCYAGPCEGGSHIPVGVTLKETVPQSAQRQHKLSAGEIWLIRTPTPECMPAALPGAKKSCPQGQSARLGRASRTVRERHHGIIWIHRINLCLLRATSVACLMWRCQTASLPQRALSRRLNLVSRRTGDQNASSV